MLPMIVRGLVAAALLAPAATAKAHALLEPAEATPGAAYEGRLVVPHGCGDRPTTALRVTIPEGVVAVEAVAKAGWKLNETRGPYARVHEVDGRRVSEGVTEIAWTNGSLPDKERGEFAFRARFAQDLADKAVPFPVLQECGEETRRWVEIAAEGQDPHDLKAPAPVVTVAGAETAKSYKVGAIVIETPWARATPGGAKVAGGYMRITNTGSEPDRLIGGTLPGVGRFEVHQMSMSGDVMRMRPVENGLEIKPGQSVELKPGGLHVMFTDLKTGLKEGQVVKGTLRFEKAGTVEIEYAVRGIGAGAGHGHAH
jgi:copper(I)-binding protein